MTEPVSQLADKFAELVENIDMLLAMRECADICTTYSGRTQEIGALVADNRAVLRNARDALRAQAGEQK